jgi:DNA (cytosine-5)-methyltransferase 1
MNKIVNAISLFSGIGAFEVAALLVFEENYKTHQFCEINETAQKVLKTHFPEVPIHSDIRDYHPPQRGSFREPTVIVGGFPCKNTSNSGKREGLDGSESGLWWEFYRVIVEFRPDFVIIENPEGLLHRGLRTILGALRMAGYKAEVEMFTAAEFGAPHKRSRIFIIAYHNDLWNRQKFKPWSDYVRDDIERTRDIITRSQIEPEICTLASRISPELSGLHLDGWWKMNPPPPIGVEKGLKGRREAVSLVGRSIAIPCAITAFLRLKFLLSL